ncbi:phosphatidylglycerophosphate phosphatase 1, chloroplastic/mitochondrial [Macadamia integrifolia]|uniref:phosphatidylglycerophosphate phosphatase 1, chloroplastic/mitochondrial n=1 Tax=Macadamia integrifolia TaxID=60698 RepID=UPI001C4FE22D|nr:phosphatidylglycerophosphate phosphatase 1, chloroplastic/mitochondrial [Macadamia integrifolia]
MRRVIEQPCSIASISPPCCHPLPKHKQQLCLQIRSQTAFTKAKISSGVRTCLTTRTIRSYSLWPVEKEKKKKEKIKENDNSETLLLEEKHSVVGDTGIDNKYKKSHNREERQSKNKTSFSGISSNMWWRNLKAVLGQSFNLEGISSSVAVVTRDRHLAVPHITVPDISWIDWAGLERRGFRGVIFDKDNTLTAPYSLALWPPLNTSLERCRSVFDENVAIFSNSAGLYQYDVDGSKAAAIEKSLGIRVVRHGTKKPAGTAEEIEKDFGYDTSLLVMVGDRHFTDIVYGNRNGFLTILTEPISPSAEPFIVKQVRKMEKCLVNSWCRRGLKPTGHNLLQEAIQCVKDPSTM